jgi:hypothetical protein
MSALTQNFSALTTATAKVAEARKAASLTAYREIILRADHPQPDDAKTLLDLLAALEITRTDVEQDINDVAEIRRAEAALVEYEKNLPDLQATMRDSIAKLSRLDSERSAAERAMLVATAASGNTDREITQRRYRLRELRANARMFDAVPEIVRP